MNSVVMSYSVALSLIGLWCCGHANEISPPDVLVVLDESDNSVSNDFNSVSYPVEKFSHIHNVQFWNKYFDNFQKKINMYGHFLRSVAIPINFRPHMIKRFKKSISVRKPRSADVTTVSSINHSQSSLSSVSALPIELNTNMNKSEIKTINTTVSTTTKSNMIDLESSENSTVDSHPTHPTDSTTLIITSNPKFVETTTLIQQKTQNTSNDNSIAIEKTDTSSSEQNCIYCPGKMIFLTGMVILAFAVTFVIYKKRLGRGSRTFYQVRNICSKNDESPV